MILFSRIVWKTTEEYVFARDLALIELPLSFSLFSISIKPICLHKKLRKSKLYKSDGLRLTFKKCLLVLAVNQDVLRLKQFTLLGT